MNGDSGTPPMASQPPIRVRVRFRVRVRVRVRVGVRVRVRVRIRVRYASNGFNLQLGSRNPNSPCYSVSFFFFLQFFPLFTESSQMVEHRSSTHNIRYILGITDLL